MPWMYFCNIFFNTTSQISCYCFRALWLILYPSCPVSYSVVSKLFCDFYLCSSTGCQTAVWIQGSVKELKSRHRAKEERRSVETKREGCVLVRNSRVLCNAYLLSIGPLLSASRLDELDWSHDLSVTPKGWTKLTIDSSAMYIYI